MYILKQVNVYKLVQYTQLYEYDSIRKTMREDCNRDKSIYMHICELIAQPHFNTM
jgi:hypothetical protein